LTGSFAAAGQSAPITVGAGFFHARLGGTFTGTAQLERSTDGVNWFPCSRDSAGTVAAYTAPCNLTCQEPVGAAYRWNCTAFTSGPITYSIDAPH
jgi:hypothetical protein